MRFFNNRNFIVMTITVALLGICAALSGIFPKPQLVTADMQQIIAAESLKTPLMYHDEIIEENEFEVIEDTIVVHVAGEVENPGVYNLAISSRVIDAIDIAGGMTTKAAANQVNLAMPISDGQQVYIPSEAEIEPKQINDPKNRLIVTKEETVSTDKVLLINVNTANVDELSLLPGIGLATAENIVKYRETVGSFDTTEDLIKVSGIGEVKLAKIYPHVTVK